MPAAIATSSSSLQPGILPISSLPSHVFCRVLSHLDSPLDLYRASLVNHEWRAAATDSKLWQAHYWTFYRAQVLVYNDEDRILLEHRTSIRFNAMRTWLEKSTTAAPASTLGPLATMTASGEMLMYEPLEKGLLMVYHMQKFKGVIETAHRLNKIVVEIWGDKGPNDLEEAAERLVKILVKETGKQPTVEDIEFAERAYKEKLERSESFALPEREPAYPHFLKDVKPDSKSLPDFYSIFVNRMNEDERLMRDLRTHVGLDTKILASAFDMIERYGDRARDLLIAICADQQISSQSVKGFATSPGAGGSDSKKDWPHALDVHMRAAAGRPQPRLGHCVSLEFTARQLLGHLQRREALTTVQQLRTRFESPPPAAAKTQTLRERIIQCCIGVEQAMESLALFHFGERSETREYLDLLAMFVFKDIEARARGEGREPLEAEPPNEFQDPTAHRFPSGSTRIHMGLIERSLRRLGFVTVLEGTSGADDFDNFYINTSLLSPAQRTTSPIIMLVILCAVARRLGIAITPVNAPSYAMAVVLEDGPKPDDWYGVAKDWGKFYWAPSRNGKFSLHEESQMKSELAGMASAQARSGQKRIFEPASPLEILVRMGEEMMSAVQHGKRQAAAAPGDAAPHHDPMDMILDRIVSPVEQLTSFRDYLWGRNGHLPRPLPPPVLASSLAILPPAKAGLPRVNPPDLKQHTNYVALWAVRVADPSRSGGPKIADNMLSVAIAQKATLRCDLALLLQVNGADVKAELDEARKIARGGSDSGVASHNGRPRAPVEIREFLSGALEVDTRPNKGFGGYGGGTSKRERELLDPAHARNAAVEHGVGTVFTHKVHGWRGVVFGWDVTCKSTSVWDDKITTDPSPPGSRNAQPYYHAYSEDGSRHYVLQSNIILTRVPAGSTPDEAAALLRPCVQLFNLRNVAKCFRTIQVAPWKSKTKGGKGGAGGTGSGQVKMVMNPWMRKAWPFD